MSKPVAIVTGASRGIGECIVGTLDDMGYRCALVARTEDKLEQIRNKLGTHHRVFPADLSDLGCIPGLVSDIVDDMERLDVLVNNAGVGAGGPVQEGGTEDWHQAIHVNTLAMMLLTRHAAPHLLKSTRPAVINTVSISGQQVQKGQGPYCASKHAARAFSHATFEDMREHGVKVCAICPGLVNTEMPDGEGLNRDLMIQRSDIAYTVRYVLEFPETGCPTEITIRPQRSPYVEA